MTKPYNQIIREAEARQRKLDNRVEPQPDMRKASAKDAYKIVKTRRGGVR